VCDRVRRVTGRSFPRQLLSRYEQGDTAPGWPNIEAIARALGITPADLVYGPPGVRGGRGDSSLRVRLAASERAGPPGDDAPTVEVPRGLASPQHYAMAITGREMYPTLLPGDVVLVDPSHRNLRKGQVAHVRLSSGDCLVARFTRVRSGPVLTLDNPTFPALEGDWEVLGLVETLYARDLWRGQLDAIRVLVEA